jgi:hypothetical protein
MADTTTANPKGFNADVVNDIVKQYSNASSSTEPETGWISTAARAVPGVGAGLLKGVGGVASLIGKGGEKVISAINPEWGGYDPHSFGGAYVGMGKELEEATKPKVKEGSAKDYLYKIARGVGEMAPYIAASALPGGQFIAPVAMGVMGAGGNYAATGNVGEALTSGAVQGALGTIPLHKLMEAPTKGLVNKVLTNAGAMAGVGVAGTAAQEAIHTAYNPNTTDGGVFENIIKNPTKYIEPAIVGGVTGGVLGGLIGLAKKPTVEAKAKEIIEDANKNTADNPATVAGEKTEYPIKNPLAENRELMRAALLEEGYTNEQIMGMSLQEAHEILSQKETPTPPEAATTTPPTTEDVIPKGQSPEAQLQATMPTGKPLSETGEQNMPPTKEAATAATPEGEPPIETKPELIDSPAVLAIQKLTDAKFNKFKSENDMPDNMSKDDIIAQIKEQESQSKLKAEAPAREATPLTSANIPPKPTVKTPEMIDKLKELGYSDEDIAKLGDAEVQWNVGGKIPRVMGMAKKEVGTEPVTPENVVFGKGTPYKEEINEAQKEELKAQLKAGGMKDAEIDKIIGGIAVTKSAAAEEAKPQETLVSSPEANQNIPTALIDKGTAGISGYALNKVDRLQLAIDAVQRGVGWGKLRAIQKDELRGAGYVKGKIMSKSEREVVMGLKTEASEPGGEPMPPNNKKSVSVLTLGAEEPPVATSPEANTPLTVKDAHTFEGNPVAFFNSNKDILSHMISDMYATPKIDMQLSKLFDKLMGSFKADGKTRMSMTPLDHRMLKKRMLSYVDAVNSQKVEPPQATEASRLQDVTDKVKAKDKKAAEEEGVEYKLSDKSYDDIVAAVPKDIGKRSTPDINDEREFAVLHLADGSLFYSPNKGEGHFGAIQQYERMGGKLEQVIDGGYYSKAEGLRMGNSIAETLGREARMEYSLDGKSQTPEEHTARVDSLRNILKGNVKTAVEAMQHVTDHSPDPKLRQLADDLLKNKDTKKILEDTAIDLADMPANGKYDPKTKTISLNSSGRFNEKTIMHETIHRLTSDYINRIGSVELTEMRKIIYDSLSAEDKALVDQISKAKGLDEMMSIIDKADSSQITLIYSLKNNNEFLANAMSHEGFQKYLEGFKVEGETPTTLWEKFVNFVKKAIGIGDEHTNVLDRVIKEGNRIIKEQTEGGYARGEGGAPEYSLASKAKETFEENKGAIASAPKSTTGKAAKETFEMARDKFSEYTKELKGTFAPSMSSAANKVFGQFMRKTLAEQSLDVAQKEVKIQPFRDFLAKQTPEARNDFIDYVEGNGDVEKVHPDARESATVIKSIFDDMVKQVRALNPDALKDLYENYFPHIWADPVKAKEAIAQRLERDRSLQGSKAFEKTRTFVTDKLGREEGLAHYYDNPIDTVMAKIIEIHKSILAEKVKSGAIDNKAPYIQRVEEGKKAPDGWVNPDIAGFKEYGKKYVNTGHTLEIISHQELLKRAEAEGVDLKQYKRDNNIEYNGKDEFGRVQYAQMEQVSAGSEVTARFFIPPESAKILEHYLQPGLRDKSAIARDYLSIANHMNAMQLGFSGFHFGFTALDSMVSQAALGVRQMAQGDIGEGLKNIAKFPISPYETYIKGDKIMKSLLGNMDGELAKDFVSSGGRVNQDAFYRTTMYENFTKSLREHSYGMALLKAPFALTEKLMSPLFEKWVPKLKLGAWANLMEMELKKNPGMSDVQRAEAGRSAWDSIDNRLGQMVYDNLFGAGRQRIYLWVQCAR